MGRAPCCDKANVKKGPWSPEEDSKLKDYMDKFGTGGNWIALPHKAGLKRCGKSCRLRWLNYLRPNLKHGEFSDEEDNFILNLFATIGSRWSIIASQLPGRTDNDIKNYWNTKLKKKLIGMMNIPPPHNHRIIRPSHQSIQFPCPPYNYSPLPLSSQELGSLSSLYRDNSSNFSYPFYNTSKLYDPTKSSSTSSTGLDFLLSIPSNDLSSNLQTTTGSEIKFQNQEGNLVTPLQQIQAGSSSSSMKLDQGLINVFSDTIIKQEITTDDFQNQIFIGFEQSQNQSQWHEESALLEYDDIDEHMKRLIGSSKHWSGNNNFFCPPDEEISKSEEKSMSSSHVLLLRKY